MRSVHVKVVAEADGELHLCNLPIQKGDAVEAIVIVPDGMTRDPREQRRDDFLRHAAWRAFPFLRTVSVPRGTA